MSAAPRYMGMCSNTPAVTAAVPAQKATGWWNVMPPVAVATLRSWLRRREHLELDVVRVAQGDHRRAGPGLLDLGVVDAPLLEPALPRLEVIQIPHGEGEV